MEFFFSTNPLPEAFSTNNLAVANAMFLANEEIWSDYAEGRDAFSTSASIELRTNQATAIGNAAIAIRLSKQGSTSSVIETHTVCSHTVCSNFFCVCINVVSNILCYFVESMAYRSPRLRGSRF